MFASFVVSAHCIIINFLFSVLVSFLIASCGALSDLILAVAATRFTHSIIFCSISIDDMCNLQNPRSSEKAFVHSNVDISCGSRPLVDKKDSGEPNGKSGIESEDSSESESNASLATSQPIDSLKFIPFSATFGKSEKLREIDKLGISLDSRAPLRRRLSDGEQHLRRRARSSEGCMTRKNGIEYFEEIPYFEGRKKNNESVTFSSQFSSDANDEIRRRKGYTNQSPGSNRQKKESRYDKQDKIRRHSVIPIEHPFKIVWDTLTVILSIAHSYLTHMAIRDRQFESSPFFSFCQAWFLVDILLNFFTERKTSTGEIICDHRRIVARYLTSWFAVDILSLIPWEVLYVKPLIDVQNRRGFFKKSFFRSKAVVRVTRHLRGKHFRWFGTVAKHTKQHGIGAQRLLRLIIKYVPKYVMFMKNMKGVVAVRILRFVHWSRRSMKNIESTTSDVSAKTMVSSRGDDDRNLSVCDDGSDAWEKRSFEVFNDWETIDDDGVPM